MASTIQNLVKALMFRAPQALGYDDAMRVARSMRRAAAKATRFNERRCSDFLFSAKDEREAEKLDKRFAEQCAALGCKAAINGDPRGVTFRIVFPDTDDGLGFAV